jgi:hypothetical protein
VKGGQQGIALREALAAGDAEAAIRAREGVDEAHVVEMVLGAALRDARDGHRAARLWEECARHGRPDRQVIELLCQGTPDTSLDERAAAWIAARRVEEDWRPGGLPLDRRIVDVEAVAAAYAAGVAGLALLDAMADLPLAPAVSWYYRRGRIHALGPRPLLVLGMTATSR